MNILWVELRRNLLWMLAWTALVCLGIIICLPVLTGSSYSLESIVDIWGQRQVGDPAGYAPEIDYIIGPFGFVSYLYNFITAATAIQGLMLGLILVAREIRYHTADFMLTKPVSRLNVFFQKYMAGLACLTITQLMMSLTMFLGFVLLTDRGTPLAPLLLVFLCIFLTQIFSYTLGMLLSAYVPQLTQTIATAVAIMVAFFLLYVFAYFTGHAELLWFTPLGFFDMNYVLQNQAMDVTHLLVGVAVMALALALAGIRYVRRDIRAS
jgi:ABC-2 type transport system permease protein